MIFKLIKQDKIFIIVSVLVGILMINVHMGSDDLLWVNRFNAGNQYSMLSDYETWSSRILINKIVMIFLITLQGLWPVYMAVMTYLFFKAMEHISPNKIYIHTFIASIFLMIPFYFETSAGWICTTCSYYGPIACSILSLVPIKKILYDESIKSWEYFIYAVALLYGTNCEQGLVLNLAGYVALLLYLGYKKIVNKYLCMGTIFLICNLIFTLTCPGNLNRKFAEINRYPSYELLDITDKLDLGISTTLHMLVFKENTLLWTLAIVLGLCIWKKYDELKYRIIAVYPVIILSLLGPLKSILERIDSRAMEVFREIPMYGLINVDMARIEIIQGILLISVIICITSGILLVYEYPRECLQGMFLWIIGLVTRFIMGFSPTVFASGTRTFELLYVCVALLVVHIVSSNYNLLKQWIENQYIQMLLYANIIVSLFQIGRMVNTVFE